MFIQRIGAVLLMAVFLLMLLLYFFFFFFFFFFSLRFGYLFPYQVVEGLAGELLPARIPLAGRSAPFRGASGP